MYRTLDMFVSFCIRRLYGGVYRHKCPCCVRSSAFIFNWIVISNLSIIFVFVKGSFISLLINKLNSGVHVCEFPYLFKDCHFCQILGSHSGDGDDWSHWVCYMLCHLENSCWHFSWWGMLCTSQCCVTSQKTWIFVSSISVKSFVFLQCSGLRI